MRTLTKSKAQSGIWLEEKPIPAIGHNDLLIKIKKTAICGTDVHIFNWDPWAQENVPVSLTIGHEFMGEVVEIGSEVRGFKLGDRVSGEGHITCGQCRNCRAGMRHLCKTAKGIGVNIDGCFAEFLRLPAENAFLLGDHISDDIAATLDPLGNAVHAALSFDLVGEDVLITGAGPIGCMSAAIARHVGARHIVVTDINKKRLSLAKKMGATVTVDPNTTSLDEVMQQLGMCEGFDVSMEMSGSPAAIEQMLNATNHGGRLALLGITPNQSTIDWNQIIFKALTLKGIYGRKIFETWYKMSTMLQSGLDIKPIITDHFSANQFEQAFAIMCSGKSGKVILDWT